jgi:tRNA U34 5-methylaminomethyl-2-thiouridine-forming methyltransferase MnmC
MKQQHNFNIEKTLDGSSTIYLPELDEHYHSVKGALAESEHIYRDTAFIHRLNAGSKDNSIRVLEIGFGTGLNAVLTAMAAPENVHVYYSSLELFPLDFDVVQGLGYGEITDKHLFEIIHRAPWNEPVDIVPNFTLHKINADLLTAPLPVENDVVFFDAFAPEKQPEMWSTEVLKKVVDSMAAGGILATYCAKGIIRRALASLNLTVERLPGPAHGKREILRATKPAK